MPKNQLFKKIPDNELLLEILETFGVSNLEDNKPFSRNDIINNDTIKKIETIKNKLEECYLPCKSRLYLNSLTEKNIITILRQVVKTRGYTLSSREKYIKGVKFIVYSITKIDADNQEIVDDNQIEKPEEKKVATKKTIVVAFD
jgi:hypothetical protein